MVFEARAPQELQYCMAVLCGQQHYHLTPKRSATEGMAENLHFALGGCNPSPWAPDCLRLFIVGSPLWIAACL